VNGATVHTFEDVRREVCAATRRALDAGEGAAVTLRLALPALGPAGLTPEEDVALPLARADLEAVHALGWSADHVLLPFDLARFTDRAGDPWHALAKGVAKTHSVVLLTYVTFLRLFQGTVPVDQLHGPVGITHIGSQVAAEGFIYLVFFLGLISANLAVINFLPLPIVDGGHMVFLLIEGVTRRPVSAGVQNAAIVAGLLLVGTVFVVVTFNDLVRLLG
jgi:regulator of sigma E protease